MRSDRPRTTGDEDATATDGIELLDGGPPSAAGSSRSTARVAY